MNTIDLTDDELEILNEAMYRHQVAAAADPAVVSLFHRLRHERARARARVMAQALEKAGDNIL